MTPAERSLWIRAQRRVAGMEPEIAAAILRAFAIIRDALSEAELTRLIDSGDFESIITRVLSDTVLDRAFIPVRDRIRRGTADSFRYFVNDLPKGGKVNGQLAISFDYLNPNVIDAIRTIETKALTTLKQDIRDTVRAYVENGIRAGVNPRTTARQIRTVVGLAPNQMQEVANYRAELEAGRSGSRYTLRDKRYDSVAKRGDLTPQKIDKMVETYRKRRVALNAETNARTASLDAMKAGQKLSWDDAIAKGIVDPDKLMKRWMGVLDTRERPEHVAMEGETVPYNALFSNGEMICGDSTWNCRCIPKYFATA